MSYATRSDLAQYLAVPEPELPQQADRLLARASEDIAFFTMGRLDTDLPAHQDAARQATCAQVEFFLEAGEGIGPAVTQRTVGRVSESYASASPQLAPRAHRILAQAGLLYAGAEAL